MYSLQLLLSLAVFLVIEAETSPMKEESILKKRDAPINSIKALAENIKQAFNYEYQTDCLYSSCPNLATTPASCDTMSNGNTAEMDAVSPVLIQCASNGACGVNKFVQTFKQTNISLEEKNHKNECNFTSNPGKLILSDIKQTAKATAEKNYDIHVTGKMTLADCNLECLNLEPIPIQIIFKLDFTYHFNNGLEDGLSGNSLDYSAIIEKKYAHLFSKVFKVFLQKGDQLSNSICGALSKLLASLYTSFYVRKCD